MLDYEKYKWQFFGIQDYTKITNIQAVREIQKSKKWISYGLLYLLIYAFTPLIALLRDWIQYYYSFDTFDLFISFLSSNIILLIRYKVRMPHNFWIVFFFSLLALLRIVNNPIETTIFGVANLLNFLLLFYSLLGLPIYSMSLYHHYRIKYLRVLIVNNQRLL